MNKKSITITDVVLGLETRQAEVTLVTEDIIVEQNEINEYHFTVAPSHIGDSVDFRECETLEMQLSVIDKSNGDFNYRPLILSEADYEWLATASFLEVIRKYAKS